MKHIISIIVYSVITLLTYIFLGFSWFSFLILTLVFVAQLFLGIFNIRYNYFISSKNRLNDRKVLLSFDDGPDIHCTAQILEILHKYDVGALFFVVGNRITNETRPLIEKMKNNGHVIGNHTFKHSNGFALGSFKSVAKELKACDESIGFETKYFRPPVGITNPTIARVVKRMNKKVIGWSLRSFDTRAKSPSTLLLSLQNKVAPGGIILLHDNMVMTRDILEEFIISSRKKGIVFVKPNEIEQELTS